jgi:hypothetical protein
MRQTAPRAGESSMYFADKSPEAVERDPRNDPRMRQQTENEIVIDRKPVVADSVRDPETGTAPSDRRRTERRRIERMGTDI